ncbi:MAG: hypothetical protein IPP90_10660 [Gemmatimonadaceae bacterium]|nr:hypothetical protein [Gemmatimonadaceae bacterium]
MKIRTGAVVLVLGAAGCAHRPSTSDSGAATASTRDGDVITAQELSDPSVGASNALDAVRRLRPRFLASRGRQSIMMADAGTVHISVNGGPLLVVNDLSRMRPGEIFEIRYLNSSDAAQRFGTSSGSGPVLLVKTK